MTELKGFKIAATWVLVLMQIESDIKQNMSLLIHTQSSKIVNESDIDNAFESVYTKIISNMQKSLGRGSG